MLIADALFTEYDEMENPNAQRTKTRQYLKESDFENLFTQELGWDHRTQTLPVKMDETIKGYCP